jgi:hypothetical protein
MFKKITVALFLVVCLSVFLFPLTVYAYSGGAGTAINPYLLSSEMDWHELCDHSQDWSKHFKLTQDIDFSGTVAPVGNKNTPFTGTFDGNNYRCWNASTDTGTELGALFGIIDGDAVIRNLGTVFGVMHGTAAAGGLVAEMRGGTVQDCYARNEVKPASSLPAGGLVGVMSGGTIINCYSTGDVTRLNQAGGLIGVRSDGTVVNSYWDIETSGQATSAGGKGLTTAEMTYPYGSFVYAGWSRGWHSDAGTVNNHYPYRSNNAHQYSEGDGSAGSPFVIASSWDWELFSSSYNLTNKNFILAADIDLAGMALTPVGAGTGGITGLFFDGQGYSIRNATIHGGDYAGLFSRADSSVLKNVCVNTISVEGGDYTGGLAGSASSSLIENCSVTGHVEGGNYTGGFIGTCSSQINHCFSRASVTGINNVAGFAARITGDDGVVTYSYSAGAVSAVGTDIFGFSPYSDWVGACYWDMESTGVNSSSGGGIGRTTAEMTTPYAANTYEFWDFSSGGPWTDDFLMLRNDGYPLPRTLLHFSKKYSGGDGTAFTPYQISTPGDWVQLMITQEDWEGKHFELTADLDFQGYDLHCVGKEGIAFTGVFDGQYHKVSKGRIYFPENSYVGLFGNVDGDGATTGILRNLTIEDFSVTGGEQVGILAGYAKGAIQRCEASGEVAGDGWVGGVCGQFQGTLSYSSFRGSVAADYTRAGGLCGVINVSSVLSCRIDAVVQGTDYTGGLAGRAFHTDIEKCHVSGTVSGSDYSGGLAGLFTVSGSTIKAVSESSSSATVTGAVYTGGLFGQASNLSLINAYASGAVTGVREVGGLGGRFVNCQSFRCYACGAVSGDDATGGLVAVNDGGADPGSYWDVDASGQYFSGRGTGKSTADLTWPYANPSIWQVWDFDNIWFHDISGKKNGGYPLLRDRLFEANPGYAGGSGTEEDPFLIDNAGDLQVLAETPLHWGSHFRLTADIDFQGQNIAGIGALTPVQLAFTGTFDGAHYSISNGNINEAGEAGGLFKVVQYPGVIRNLHLFDFSVSGENNVGSLAGKLSGVLVENCSVSASVRGVNTVGGLIGLAEDDSRISTCWAVVDVKGKTNTGGLIGRMTDSTAEYTDLEGTVESSDSMGGGFVGRGTNSVFMNNGASADVAGKKYIGGFAGLLTGGETDQCSASGEVTGQGDYPDSLGGFAGSLESEAFIHNSTASGNVKGNASYSGGFVGYGTIQLLVEECSAEGSVEGTENTGGFAGYLIEDCRIKTCSAAGNVSGRKSAGGFVGLALEDTSFDQCTSTGDVEASGDHTGGFAGYLYETELSDCSSTGAVTGNNFVGGFLGKIASTSSTLAECTSTGDVEGREHVGGFAGSLVDTPATACHASGSVEGRKHTGGFAGFIKNTTVQTCYAEGLVKGVGSNPEATGGFAGTVEYSSKLQSCYASGKVTGTSDVGGFVGDAVGYYEGYLDMEACYALGTVKGENNVGGFGGSLRESLTVKKSHAGGTVEGLENTGGFAGWVFEGGEISYNHALGTVEGKTATGGFVGAVSAGSNFRYCFTLGNVEGTTDPGGFAGKMHQAEVECCYTRGAVKGKSSTGGFAAKSLQTALLDSCYAAGAVSGDTGAGGFVKSADGPVTRCYWDMDLAGLSWSAAGEGLSSADMRFPASSSHFVGWDFDTIWRVDYADENDGYPLLREEGEQYSGGTGTRENPYQLLLPADWAKFSASPADWSKHFALTADLDFAGQTFTPAGNSITAFTGSFDGLDHAIRNVVLTADGDGTQGDSRAIFGVVGSGGAIRNLHCTSIEISGRDRVGGLVGAMNKGTVAGCTLTDSSISGRSHVGGLVGYAENHSRIENSATDSTVRASSDRAGGIAGSGEGSIFRRVQSGGIVSSAGSMAGGLSGFADASEFQDACSTASVSAVDRAGGLLGEASYSNIERCYAIGMVEPSGKTGALTGGLIGFDAGGSEIMASYWNQESTGQGGSVSAGRRNTDQMAGESAQSNYKNWDFDGVWAMPEDLRLNQGYPYLRAIPAAVAADSWHPADLNRNWTLEENEALHYMERWQKGAVPMVWAVRTGFLSRAGHSYVFDASKPMPDCWSRP